MHTGNFESAALPGNLRQDGVYMTNDRIPYAKKSTLPRRFFSLVSPLHTPSTLILFIPPARVCFEYTYNAVHRSLAPLALALCVSLSLSLSLSLFLVASSRIPCDIMSAHVMETDGWYMETSNVTARGAVWKRSPFQFASSRCHGRKAASPLSFW